MDTEKSEHYLRGVKWYTNRGDVPTCNCGNVWPCPYRIQVVKIDPVQSLMNTLITSDHPALNMTTLEKETMLKRYENIGLTPEEYVELRKRCGLNELIEGEVIE